MTKWILGLAAAILAATAPVAAARTMVAEPSGAHYPYQEWVDLALVPTPDLSVSVVETSVEAGCPYSLQYAVACVVYTDPVPTIYLSPEGAAAGNYPRKSFYHELGHVVDHYVLPEWMREQFMLLTRLTGPWRTTPEASSAPVEYFAEAWAQCAKRPFLKRYRGWEDYGPIWQEDPIGGRIVHNRTCRMLARL